MIGAVERERVRERKKINFPPHKISEIRLFRVGKNWKEKTHNDKSKEHNNGEFLEIATTCTVRSKPIH